MAGTRRARRCSSSAVAALRICSCSETPAVAAETVKSRGVITPRSLPAAVGHHQVLGVAVEHEDQRLGGRVAERDGRHRGVHHLPGRDARRPTLDEHPAPQQRVGDEPELAVLERDDGEPHVAAGHRGGDVRDRVVRLDHQRVGLDQLVDEAVGAQRDPAAQGQRAPCGQEAHALAGGEDGLHRGRGDRRCRRRLDGHRPRPDRALRQHGGEPEDAADADPLVGGVPGARAVAPPQVHPTRGHDVHLDADVHEGVEDQLPRAEPLDPGHPDDLVADRGGHRVERRGLREDPAERGPVLRGAVGGGLGGVFRRRTGHRGRSGGVDVGGFGME